MLASLKEANLALAQGRYADAIHLYYQIIDENKDLAKTLAANIKLAQQKSDTSFVVSGPNFFILHDEKLYLDLKPSADLISSNKLGNSFQSVSSDPQFLSQTLNQKDLDGGWYEWIIQIEAQNNSNHSQLYINYGSGFSELNSYRLPLRSKESCSRVVYFNHSLHQIRLDPVDRIGEFSIIKCALQKLDEREVLELMMETLRKQQLPLPTDFVKLLNESNKNYSHEDLLEIYWSVYEPTFNQVIRDGITYEQWISFVETPSIPATTAIQQSISEFEIKPLISIILPTYNSNKEFLSACIESVINQTYSEWELCIADDASTDESVVDLINSYVYSDSRIKFFPRKKNGNISEASNTALNLAAGDYVALLDHDDVLSKNALFFICESINQHKDGKIFYSDEDKVDEFGNRFAPHFKSDWNPDLFYSQNYVSHLGVYQRSLLDKIRGFRVGVEGAQDQDLLLRCLPHTDASQIIHVPKILYHWRAVKGSTAKNASEKIHTSEAGLRSLRDFFQKADPAVVINLGELPNTYRLTWPIPKQEPMVSLVIPTRDKVHLLKTCVDSILEKTTYGNYEIIIVDNGSVEKETIDYLEKIVTTESRIRVIHDYGDFNFSRLNNFAFSQSNGEIYGLINNDIEVINPDWLTEMVSHAVRPEIGCVGAKLIYSDGKIQHAGVILGIGGVAGHSHKYYDRNDNGYFSRLKLVQNISAVTAACLVVRKEIYDAVSGLDEENLKIAFNDVDFCLKVRNLGFRNLWTPYAELYHHESLSRGKADTPEKQAQSMKEVHYMQSRWGQLLKVDPHYNNNLTLVDENFSLKNPNEISGN